MSTSLRDPYIQRALASIRKARRDGLLGQTTINDPTVDMIQGAIFRSQAIERKNVRITWEEKQEAFAEMGFKPYPKQAEIAADGHTFRHVRAGGRSGKALALDTPIPTPDGWTTMAFIKEGDTVFDEQGKQCKVTFVSEIFEDHDCYEVVFGDGSRITADAGHKWWVHTRKGRRGGKPEYDNRYGTHRLVMRKEHPPEVLTTEEMSKKVIGRVRAMKSGGERNYSIPPCSPIECDEKILPIDPYVLGGWLGDGNSSSSKIWSDDPEIIEEVRRRGYRVHKTNQKFGYWIEGMNPALTALGVRHNKHIPPEYLRASVGQRTALLQGLVDTDGYIGAGGDVEIATIHACLAYEMKELVETLGCKCTVGQGRATLNGRDCGPKFRVAFKPDFQACLLPRKAEKLKPTIKWPHRYIAEINPVAPVPTRCIQVDSPNHLYLAGNFIPTHNTSLAAAEATAVMLKKPGSFGWIVSVDYDLTRRCWDMLIANLKKLELQGKIRIVSHQDTKMSVEIDNGSRAEGQSATNGEDLQGIGLDWLIMDEIANIAPWVFTQIILPRLVGNKGWALLIGTPIGDPWASKMVRDNNAYADKNDLPHDWIEFLFESWHNIYQFPLGREDPAILLMERTMSYEEFMEQVLAMPQRSRFVTYKEFIEEVHARDINYNPKNGPLSLSIDPSTGVNPYAVLAIQDCQETVLVIDEYYKTGVIWEDVIADLAERPWFKNVTGAIMDDNWPQERKTWNRALQKIRAPFTVRPANKSHYIEDSIPLVRSWLRDPLLFNNAIQPIRDEIIQTLFGAKGWTWRDLDEADRNRVMIRMEVALKEKPEIAMRAARLFVDRRRCRNLIDEFHHYAHKPAKRNDRNVSETPIDFMDHACDALRYFFNKTRRNYQKQVAQGRRQSRTSYLAA